MIRSSLWFPTSGESSTSSSLCHHISNAPQMLPHRCRRSWPAPSLDSHSCQLLSFHLFYSHFLPFLLFSHFVLTITCPSHLSAASFPVSISFHWMAYLRGVLKLQCLEKSVCMQEEGSEEKKIIRIVDCMSPVLNPFFFCHIHNKVELCFSVFFCDSLPFCSVKTLQSYKASSSQQGELCPYTFSNFLPSG